MIDVLFIVAAIETLLVCALLASLVIDRLVQRLNRSRAAAERVSAVGS